jgi:hypothetical protein
MKRVIYFTLVALAFVACKKEDPTNKVTGITVSPSSLELAKGNSQKLIATLSPAGVVGDVSWSSSDNAVATVNTTGVVTAVAVGSAEITAKCGDVTAKCDVSVLNVENITISGFEVLSYPSTASIKDNWLYPIAIVGLTSGVQFVPGTGFVGDGYYFDFVSACEIVNNSLQQSILGEYLPIEGTISPDDLPGRLFEKGSLEQDGGQYVVAGSWAYAIDAEGEYYVGAIEGASFTISVVGEKLKMTSYDIIVNILGRDAENNLVLTGDKTIVSSSGTAAAPANSFSSSSVFSVDKFNLQLERKNAVNFNNVLIKK